MSDLSIDTLWDNKCAVPGCYNFSVKGYTLCTHCLHGIPQKIDDENIKRLKDDAIIESL